ncbi:hypothetical protein H3T43_08755 [Lactobacillus sp. M0396]|nr:hypothetical protein [Lactobacillus sp. M0396]
MVLKPKEQLVTQLFLSLKLKQNLTSLSYSTHDLINAMKEDVRAPLSDQQLVEIFAAHDVTLSRRVIAKYRKKLNIPNSYSRKSKSID